MDVARRADAERLRRIQRRGGDEHRGEADQRVECRDKLRQRRHLDAQRDEGADAAADDDAEEDQPVAQAAHAVMGSVAITATAMPIMPNRLPWRDVTGRRQPAQRQDEQDGGDQIGERGEAGGHRARPLLPSS